MKITEDVMNDLLTIHLSGEASADTKALIDSYARENPGFAARLEAAARPPVFEGTPRAPSLDRELQVLAETRKFILLRTLAVAAALLFTLVPFTFTSAYADGRSRLGRTPASAARCTMQSKRVSAHSRAMRAASRMSASTSRKRAERAADSRLPRFSRSA